MFLFTNYAKLIVSFINIRLTRLIFFRIFKFVLLINLAINNKEQQTFHKNKLFTQMKFIIKQIKNKTKQNKKRTHKKLQHLKKSNKKHYKTKRKIKKLKNFFFYNLFINF